MPARLKTGFVLVAIACLLSVAASRLWLSFGVATDRVAGSIGADALDGSPASDFELPLRGGGKVRLSQLRGRLMMVNFWASWCGPCREEEPSIDRLSRIFDPSTFEVLAVSADEGWEPVEKFFGKRVPGYRVALDEDGKVHDRWGTNKFPETYLVDASGNLRFKFIGGRDWTSPEAIALLTALGAHPR